MLTCYWWSTCALPGLFSSRVTPPSSSPVWSVTPLWSLMLASLVPFIGRTYGVCRRVICLLNLSVIKHSRLFEDTQLFISSLAPSQPGMRWVVFASNMHKYPSLSSLLSSSLPPSPYSLPPFLSSLPSSLPVQ